MHDDPDPGDRPMVLVDGACGFCRRSASWARRQPGGPKLHFLPYQSVQAPWMDEGLQAACHEALHVRLPDGQMLRGGEALCFVLAHIGWGPAARLMQSGPLRTCTELAYQQVAKQRMFFSAFLFKDAADDEDLKAPQAALGLACGIKAPHLP